MTAGSGSIDQTKPADALAGTLFRDLVTALQDLRIAGISTPSAGYDPALLEALRIARGMPAQQAQRIVHRALAIAADQLLSTGQKAVPGQMPDQRRTELRTAFLVSAGFTEGAPMSPGERVAAAAQELGLSRRTTYRRVEEAIELIAHSLLSLPIAPMLEENDYVHSRLACRVDLRREGPYVELERSLVALTDGIDHLDDQLALPNYDGQELDYWTLEGCELDSAMKLWPSMWSIRLTLPRPLRSGEAHKFAVALRLPNFDAMEPYVGFMPRTSSYEATIDLLLGDRPARVFRLDGVPPTHSLAGIPGIEEPLTTTSPRFEFNRLRAGLSYGIRWELLQTGKE